MPRLHNPCPELLVFGINLEKETVLILILFIFRGMIDGQMFGWANGGG